MGLPVDEAKLFLGSLLVGGYVEIFLQGLLYSQFASYFRAYAEDRQTVKLAVIGLAIVTTLKTAQSFSMLWIELIEYLGDPAGALQGYGTEWVVATNPLLVAISGFYVRAFFGYRLYIVSQRWWAIVPVAVCDIIGFIFVAMATFLITHDGDNNLILRNYSVHFSCVFAGDLLLSVLTTFFLLRHKRNMLSSSVGLIHSLVRLTVESAVPGMLTSMLCLILSQPNITGWQTQAAFNNIVPQVYAVSMMWSLNSRTERRGYGSTSNGLSRSRIETHSTLTQLSNKLGGAHTTMDVELGIQVRKDTVTHTDAPDVFEANVIKYDTVGDHRKI